MVRKERLNEFQRKETSRWLLNISQAITVGGIAGFFIPDFRNLAGIGGPFVSTISGLMLYLTAMYFVRKVKV